MSINEKTITLVMIVKNESKIISRCFDSVKDYIDYWVICDTGSTDGTQQIIKDYFKEVNIPGELHEHKWESFGHNRSLAVQSAKDKSDYSLLLDADFIFIPKDKNFKQYLTADGYQIKYEGGLDYRQTLFVKSSLDWKYIGVTHEYITCDKEVNIANLDSFTIFHKADGGSRSDKFKRDIYLLEQGLMEDPDNSRYMFYLAQSYKDIYNFTKAIEFYEKRVEKGGWPEEVYFSLYQIGLCKMRRGDKFDDFKDDLLKAYIYRPSRLEALYELVKYCRLNGMADLGFYYGKNAINNEYPNDILFIVKIIHQYLFFDELALCAHNTNHSNIAINIYKKILLKGVIPKNDSQRIINNYKLFNKKIVEDINNKNDKVNNSNKVAIIIVNYNMKERADAIIKKLNETVKHPHDIILVDNGSDLVDKSEHTTLSLKKNVQTTNGWLMGLHYADSLEIINNEKYFAYCFVITSTELVDNKDIVATMVKTMKEDETVVGVHPSLTKESTTHWKHLLNNPIKDKQKVFMVDNIFSCYRASWFNSIGRFNNELTYAWGIDMETGYFAYRDNLKIVLDHNIKVSKETDIGYKMNRMNMDASERILNANNQITEYFIRKYSINYKKELRYELLGYNSDYISPKIKDVDKSLSLDNKAIPDTKKINKIPFINYIKNIDDNLKNKTLVEIGCTRSEKEQDSTLHLANFCNENNMKFITVDVNPEYIEYNKKRLNKINPTFEAIVSKGEDFLEKYESKIDFLYLDGFDFYHEYHLQERKDNYKKYLNQEITNENCWNMHLECVKKYNLLNTGIICINNVMDDKYTGKGKLAIPYLLENNYKLNLLDNDCAFLINKLNDKKSYTIQE